MLYHLLDTRVRLSARDEPEWVSFVLETYTKPRGVRRIFSGGGQIFFVGGLSRFIGFRVHHNYGFMAIGYFMPRK